LCDTELPVLSGAGAMSHEEALDWAESQVSTSKAVNEALALTRRYNPQLFASRPVELPAAAADEADLVTSAPEPAQTNGAAGHGQL
jgi:hypothetical protein